MPEERWCTLQEIADHLQVRKETVYDWIKDKSMPAHKVGRLWRFRVDEVDDWIRSGQAADASSNDQEGTK